jgi:hypothetical protein
MYAPGLDETNETAIMRFQQHVKRGEDGTFQLQIEDAETIGIDPELFTALKNSLEETNRKIRAGELDSNQVNFVHY